MRRDDGMSPRAAPAASASLWLWRGPCLRSQPGRGAASTSGPGCRPEGRACWPNSAARFSAQHYSSRSAGSSLAKRLLRYSIMWPWLGISDVNSTTVKSWMTNNLDRARWFVPAGRQEVLTELEVLIRTRVGSAFEGAA